MEGKMSGMATCEPAYKFQKAASITINGYLNFLTEYKKRYCGISPQDVIRFGAREWNKLSLQEKERFKNMVSKKYLRYDKYIVIINKRVLETTCGTSSVSE